MCENVPLSLSVIRIYPLGLLVLLVVNLSNPIRSPLKKKWGIKILKYKVAQIKKKKTKTESKSNKEQP